MSPPQSQSPPSAGAPAGPAPEPPEPPEPPERPGRSRSRRLKRAAQLLATLMVSLTLALAAGELVLRFAHPRATQPFEVRNYIESERGKFAQYHSVLGWIGKPDADGDFATIDARHHVHQNRYGFRGPAYGPGRGAKRRLVVLGDSFVWGYGVDDDALFTAILERRSAMPLEVVNLGVSGYGTDQEYLLWQTTGRQFQPDQVLLVVTVNNDLVDIILPMRYGYPKPRFVMGPDGNYQLTNTPVPAAPTATWVAGSKRVERPPRSKWCMLGAHSHLVGSALLSLARIESVRQAFERQGILPPRETHFERAHLVFRAEPPPPENARGWDLFARLLQALDTDVTGAGAKLIVAIAPGTIDIYDDDWDACRAQATLSPGTHWDRDAPRQRIAEACRRLNIRAIDLTPGLRAAAKTDPDLYFRWNGHWTTTGHRCVADLLLTELK